MGRENLNPNYKFGSSDGFMLTDIDTNESLMLIPCDTAGNFSWTGVTRAPLVRNALQTTTTSNQYSDIERPWISIPQEDWNGGRGNNTFTKDTTRYLDGKRSQTAFQSVIYNTPLDYYSKGFRKAETNCPGSLKWMDLKGQNWQYGLTFQAKENFIAGEMYIHLRKRGNPRYPLVVSLGYNSTTTKLDEDSAIATHSFTAEEIDDTLAEFAKFTFDGATINSGESYVIRIYSLATSDPNNYWQIGVSTDKEEIYYRIAEPQSGYVTKFFQYRQVMWMVRQLPNGTPKLYMNGYLGKATGGGTRTLEKTSSGWTNGLWKGARVGLTYGRASTNRKTAWKQIVSNTSTVLTVDSDWDNGTYYPSTDTEFVIVDTPVWREVTGHSLTAPVTDVHVVRDTVYFAQGDYVDAVKMRYNQSNGALEYKSMTGIKASFFCSVRDSAGMMLYRGLNNGIRGKRMVDRARLLDWLPSDDHWTTISEAITTQEPIEKHVQESTTTSIMEPATIDESTTEDTWEKITSGEDDKAITVKDTTTETIIKKLPEDEGEGSGSGGKTDSDDGDDIAISRIREITEEGKEPMFPTPTGADAEAVELMYYWLILNGDISIMQDKLIWILKKDGTEIIGTVVGKAEASTPTPSQNPTITIQPSDGGSPVTVNTSNIIGYIPGENGAITIILANGTSITGTITAYDGQPTVPTPSIVGFVIELVDGSEITVLQTDIDRYAFFNKTTKTSRKQTALQSAVQPKLTTVTKSTITTVDGVAVEDYTTETTKSESSTGVTSDGWLVTDQTDTVERTIIKHPEIPLRTCVVTDVLDNVEAGDYDCRQYIIDIGNFESENYTGQCVITLQESDDNEAYHNVQSVVATGTGLWYIFAKCEKRYRRFMVTATGTNCTVNNISFTSTDALKFEDPVYLLDNYGKITRLFEYGAEQFKSLWIFQEGMVSSINKDEGNVGGQAYTTYTHDLINMKELQVTADEWNGSAVDTTDVYLTFGWLNGWQRYYNTQIEGKGPDHDEGLPFNRQGRVSQIIGYPSNVFISIDGEDGYSSVMQFNQSGWNEIYRAPNRGERILDMGFQPIYGKRPDRLWMQVGDDVVWLAMPSKILYAIQDPNAEYTHESVVVSAWITAGMADVEKLWESLKIMADYLDGKECWIEADYQIDEEPEWHPFKSFYTESPSDKQVFSNDRSVNGKKMRYRLRLQTTNMHRTPKVNVVVIEAVGRVDIKQSYTFYFRNIKYKRDLNGGFEDVEPLEVQNLLDKWANGLKKLRLNSRWLIYDDKIVYLDAVQTSVLNEVSEGYIAQVSLNEL